MKLSEFLNKLAICLNYNKHIANVLNKADEIDFIDFIKACDASCQSGRRIVYACYTGEPTLAKIFSAKWIISPRLAERYRREYAYTHIAKVDTLWYHVESLYAERRLV